MEPSSPLALETRVSSLMGPLDKQRHEPSVLLTLHLQDMLEVPRGKQSRDVDRENLRFVGRFHLRLKAGRS